MQRQFVLQIDVAADTDEVTHEEVAQAVHDWADELPALTGLPIDAVAVTEHDDEATD